MISFCFTHKNRLSWNTGKEVLPLFKNCLFTLKNCLESLEIDEYEICVSSWDEEIEYRELEKFLNKNFDFDKIRLKKVEDNVEFSRGTGRNISFEQSSGDIIFFQDTDMLFVRTHVISRGIEIVKSGKAYFPICHSFYEDGSSAPRPSGYGNCVVPRKAMEDIRWIHKKSWGKEDDMFHDSVKKLYKVLREAPSGYYHQWHPPAHAGKGWVK